jgi:polyhydroxyalkanoate synthesis repressor PhaR
MSEPRIIKKYQNRCLYDTSQSKYISLADLKNLVTGGESFEVREVKTDKDITRQVLLQIIAEEENEGTPLFTTDVLMRFIRMYGDSVQDAFSSYMEQSLGFFDQQTKQIFDQLGAKVDTTPMSVFTEMTRKNLDLWQEAQKNFYKTTTDSGEKGK